MESKEKIYFSTSYMPNYGAYYMPYAWGMLRSSCSLDPEIEDKTNWVPSYVTESVDEILDDVSEPFLFGFSCFVWAWEKQLAIAKRVKAKYPKCHIVFGGPQIEIKDSSFFEKYPFVDFVLHGESEFSFRELVKNLLNNELEVIPEIKGVSSKSHNHWSAQKGERLKDYSEIPSPFLQGYFETHMEIARKQGLQVGTVFETNRGCPYRCSYCDWGEIGGKVYRSSTERFKEEAEFFGKNKFDFIYCIDANTGLFPEDETNIDELIRVREKYGFPRSYYNTMAKNSNERVYRMTKKLHDSGFLLRGATLSLQSLSERALASVNRKMMTGENYIQLFKRYMAEGIPTYTELILGLPGESLSSFRKGFSQLWKMGVKHGISIYPLSLLPNAPMNEPEYKNKYKIKTVSRPLLQDFNSHIREQIEVVVETNTMSKEDWVEMQLYGTYQIVARFGGVFDYVFEWLHRRYDVNFEDYYDKYYDWARETREGTTIGRAMAETEQMYLNIFTDPETNCFGYQPITVNGMSGWGQPFNSFWLGISFNAEEIFAELAQWLMSQFNVNVKELNSVVSFQKESLVRYGFDPEVGETYNYEFNWPAYFKADEKGLEPQETQVIFKTKQLGELHPMFMFKGQTLCEYIQVTQGVDQSDRRRYIHPLDVTEVRVLRPAKASLEVSH